MRSTRILFVVALMGAGCSVADEDACASDEDCKGERVCEAGECVDPEDGSSSPSSDGPTGGTPGSSSGGGSCTGTEVECASSTDVNVCQEGAFVTYPCAEVCQTFGFAAGPCDGSCACGEPTNEHCALGVAAICFCIENNGETPCTGDEKSQFYVECHQQTAVGGSVSCFADHVDGNAVDCNAATNTCF